MNIIKKIISLFIIFLFTSTGLYIVNVNAQDYILTKADGEKVIKIGEAIDKLIVKKGEKYREKYITALKKLKLKYRNNQRLAIIIQEVIDYLNDDMDDLDKLFTIEINNNTSTIIQSNNTKPTISTGTTSTGTTSVISNSNSTTTNNTQSNNSNTTTTQTEYVCKSKEYFGYYSIGGLQFSKNGDMSYLIGKNSSLEALPTNYSLILNGKVLTNELGMYYGFLGNSKIMYDEYKQGNNHKYYIDGKKIIEYKNFISSNNIKNSNNYEHSIFIGNTVNENNYIVGQDIVVNGIEVQNFSKTESKETLYNDYGTYGINNKGDYYYTTYLQDEKTYKNINKIYVNGNQIAKEYLSSFSYIESFNGDNNVHISEKENGKFVIIKNGKEYSKEYNNIYNLRFIGENSNIGFIGENSNGNYSIINNDKEVYNLKIEGISGDGLKFSDDFNNYAYEKNGKVILNGKELPENFSKILQLDFNKSNNIDICGFSIKGDGSNIVYIDGKYESKADNFCAMGGGQESPMIGNSIFIRSEDKKSYIYTQGDYNNNKLFIDGKEQNTGFSKIEEFGYLPNNNGYYYIGENNGKFQLVMVEKTQKYCNYIEK